MENNSDLLMSTIKILDEQNELLNDQLFERCKSYWSKSEPMPLDLLRSFAASMRGKQWLREAHPFYPVWIAIEQIDIAYRMLVSARASLVEIYGHYHSSIEFNGFESIEEASHKATHEVFNYSFAAVALVQAYRRFKKIDENYSIGVESAFQRSFTDPDLVDFVNKIRNCMGHQMLFLVMPTGTIHYGEKKRVESALEFNSDALLAIDGAWNVGAKRYLGRDKILNPLEAIDKYHKMATSLYYSYKSSSGVLHQIEYQEISRCKHAIDFFPKLTWLNILVQQIKGRAVDPYPHLSRYFSDEEIERISCLASHTREQVDFMIGIRDPLGLCQEKLRQDLYEIFDCA